MNLNIENIINLIGLGSKLVKEVSELVEGVKGALSEDDAAKLEEELTKLQQKNDESFDRIMAKLKEAQGK